MSIGKVGSKGELFPPKELREKMGLEVGRAIIYRVLNRRMIIEKLVIIDKVIKKEPRISMLFKELKDERKQLSEDAST